MPGLISLEAQKSNRTQGDSLPCELDYAGSCRFLYLPHHHHHYNHYQWWFITFKVQIIIDEAHPREITQCKVWYATAPECKLGSYTHISFSLPYYSPSSDSFFWSHHFCCLDIIIILRLFHRKHKSSPRSARTTSMWTRRENNVIFRGKSHLIWSEAADIKGNFPPCGRFRSHRPCLLTLDLDKWVWWNNWNRECIVPPRNYKWQTRIWVHYSVWFWQKKNDRGNGEWELVELIDKIATCGAFQLKRGHQGWLRLLPSCHLYLNLFYKWIFICDVFRDNAMR